MDDYARIPRRVRGVRRAAHRVPDEAETVPQTASRSIMPGLVDPWERGWVQCS